MYVQCYVLIRLISRWWVIRIREILVQRTERHDTVVFIADKIDIVPRCRRLRQTGSDNLGCRTHFGGIESNPILKPFITLFVSN